MLYINFLHVWPADWAKAIKKLQISPKNKYLGHLYTRSWHRLGSNVAGKSKPIVYWSCEISPWSVHNLALGSKKIDARPQFSWSLGLFGLWYPPNLQSIPRRWGSRDYRPRALRCRPRLHNHEAEENWQSQAPVWCRPTVQLIRIAVALKIDAKTAILWKLGHCMDFDTHSPRCRLGLNLACESEPF